MFLCILTKQAHNTAAARAMRCAARYALQKKISAHLCAYFLKLLYSFVNCVQRV